MLWSMRIVAGLWVMTCSYAWTVGQSGLTTVDRNLCELWDQVFWKTVECHPHKFLWPLWVFIAVCVVVFLVVDFVRARQRAERPKLQTVLWVMVILGMIIAAAGGIGLWRMRGAATPGVGDTTRGGKPSENITSTTAPAPADSSAPQSPHVEKQPIYDIQDINEAAIERNSVKGIDRTILKAKRIGKLVFADNEASALNKDSFPPPPAELAGLSVVQLKRRASLLASRMKEYQGDNPTSDFGDEPFDLASAILASIGGVELPTLRGNQTDAESSEKSLLDSRIIAGAINVMHRKYRGASPAMTVAEFLQFIASRLP
jgi:hypothetical protein